MTDDEINAHSSTYKRKLDDNYTKPFTEYEHSNNTRAAGHRLLQAVNNLP